MLIYQRLKCFNRPKTWQAPPKALVRCPGAATVPRAITSAQPGGALGHTRLRAASQGRARAACPAVQGRGVSEKNMVPSGKLT